MDSKETTQETPTLTERHAEMTRKAIVDAGVELFFELQSFDFPVQTLADRAGVSHRTVYRHFQGRRALVNALAKGLQSHLDIPQRFADFPASIMDIPDRVEQSYEFAELNAEIFRELYRASLADATWPTFRETHYWELFRAEFPNLPEEEAWEDFAALRLLVNSWNALVITKRFDLDFTRAARGVSRAARAVLDDIADRDRAETEHGHDTRD